MNPSLIHQLAHERIAASRAAAQAPRFAPVRRHRIRARLGVLLVEAGLHLVTSAEPSRPSARLAG